MNALNNCAIKKYKYVELFNATQKNEKVVAYYNKSCDQLNLLIYKKGTDLKINDSFDIYEETWNRYLFSNVGFRWYIKCIAPIIADWSNKQEVLYQHLFQRKSTITSEILSSKNTPIKKKPQKNERKSSAKSNRSTKSTDSAQSFEMFYQKKSELKWSKVEQPKEVENTKKETKKSKNIKETKSSKDVKSPNISGYDMQQEIFTKAQPKEEGEFLGFNFNLTLPSKMFISVNRSNKNSNLNIACPNGLCVKFYCVDPINPKKMYISQQINNNTKREKDVKFETKRLFINNGDVIIMYNDDSIKIYHRSGEIDCLSRKNNVLIEKKLDFTNQKMSSIITDENETLAESSRVSHDPHGETDEGTKSENPKIMEINFIYQYYNIETIHVDGSIHYNYECNEEDFNFKDRTKLNTRLSMDPHTNQTMLIREDAFTHVRINEQSTVSEFSDGTRITNFTGKDPNKDKYMKHQKCSLFSNRNTDDSFVLIESPSFASILYDIDNGHSMAYFFDGTMINSYDINTHEFYTLDLTHFTFNLSYGLISVFSESNKIDQPNVNPIDSENYCSDDTKKYIKENHITNLSYVFTLKNDNDDVSKIPLFETGVDENTKTYTVTQKGELLVKNVMNPQSIDTSLRKSEKYKDWTDPRLIVINNDGSGVEIHSYAAIKNFITEASRDSQSVVVVDELKTKNINDINVFVPFYKKTTTWKHQYVMDSIIPHGLQSKNFREMKRFYLHGEEEPTEMKENIYFRNYEPDPLNSVSLVRRFRKYPVDNEDYKYSIYEAIKKMAANELKKWEVYHEVDVLNEKESMLKSKLAYINNMVYECCGNALNESIEREKLCIVKIENKPGDVCKINEDKKDDLTYLLEKQSINNYEIQSNPGTHSYINNEKTDLLTFDKELKDTKNLLMPTSRQIRISSLPDENWVPSSLSNDPTYYLKRKSMEMSSIQKVSGIIEESEVTDTTTINKPVSMKKVNIKSGGVKLPPIEKMQFKHSKRNVKLPACLKIGLCDDTKLERINNFSSKKTVKNISTIKLKNDMIQGRLRLFPKSTHFGTICEGYTYVSNVWLINTGNDTIRFKIVQPSNFKNDLQSISSLQVKYKPGPIAAGLRRELKLIYHAVAIGMDCQDLIEANFEVEIISENEKFLLPVKANIMSNTQFLKRQKYLKGIEDDLTSIHNNKSNNLKIWSKNTDELDGLSSPKKLNYNENLFINGNCPNRLSLI
ncbi:hypothetical protein A3Q56_02500 [Intoshia linei]|uniref:Sperm-associated antigen 17 n=1 Tax=Intoshia linei TaxID=1819745 RepID=A0A177B5R3_9BILA|nr:hypothetical protein A3Q56_02500 [Intoshia linei]